MTINLTSYGSIESGMFVKLTCDKYKATFATPTFSSQTFYFSDMERTVTILCEFELSQLKRLIASSLSRLLPAHLPLS